MYQFEKQIKLTYKNKQEKRVSGIMEENEEKVPGKRKMVFRIL